MIDLVKTDPIPLIRLCRLPYAYDLVKTRLSESEAEAKEPKKQQSAGT